MTLKDPRVVLLDEPTNGLDQNTEQQVLQALAQWMGDRTMIVVTHRPQILSLVNHIIVMDQGRIIMDGPKQAVLDRLSGKVPVQQGKPAAAQESV